MEKLRKYAIVGDANNFFTTAFGIAKDCIAKADSLRQEHSLLLEDRTKLTLPAAEARITILPTPSSLLPNAGRAAITCHYPKCGTNQVTTIDGLMEACHAINEALPQLRGGNFALLRQLVRVLPISDESFLNALMVEQCAAIAHLLATVLNLLPQEDIRCAADPAMMTMLVHMRVLQHGMLCRCGGRILGGILPEFSIDCVCFRDAALHDSVSAANTEEYWERQRIIEFLNRQSKEGKLPAFFRHKCVGGISPQGPELNELDFWEKVVLELRDCFPDSYKLLERIRHAIDSTLKEMYFHPKWSLDQQYAALFFFNCAENADKGGCRALDVLPQNDAGFRLLKEFAETSFHVEQFFWESPKKAVHLKKEGEAIYVECSKMLFESERSTCTHDASMLKSENTALVRLANHPDARKLQIVPEANPKMQIIMQLECAILNLLCFFSQDPQKEKKICPKHFLLTAFKILVTKIMPPDAPAFQQVEFSPIHHAAQEHGEVVLSLCERLMNDAVQAFYCCITKKPNWEALLYFLDVILRMRAVVQCVHPNLKTPKHWLTFAGQDFLTVFQNQFDTIRRIDVGEMPFRNLRWRLAWDRLEESSSESVGDLYFSFFAAMQAAIPSVDRNFILETMFAIGSKLYETQNRALAEGLEIAVRKFQNVEGNSLQFGTNFGAASYGDVAIDFVSGKVTGGESARCDIGEILKTPSFVKKFGEISQDALTETEHGTFSFDDARFGKVEIIPSKNFRIQRTSKKGDLHVTETLKSASEIKQFPAHKYLHQLWIWESSDHNAPYEIYDNNGIHIFSALANRSRTKFVFVVPGDHVGGGQLILELHPTPTKKEDAAVASSDVFERFESRDSWYFLADQAGKRHYAIFPYHTTPDGAPLKFELRDKQWKLAHNPQFHVDTSLTTPPFGIFSAYIPLLSEIDETTRIYIINSREMRSKSSFRGKLDFQDSDEDKVAFPTMMLYEKSNPFTLQKELHSTSVAVNLQQVYIWMCQCEYAKAFAILKRIGSNVDVDVPCEHVFMHIYYVRDTSPQNAAIKLHAFLLHSRAQPMKAMCLFDFNIFAIYLDTISHIPLHMRLTHEEERSLCRYADIFKHRVFTNRARVLNELEMKVIDAKVVSLRAGQHPAPTVLPHENIDEKLVFPFHSVEYYFKLTGEKVQRPVKLSALRRAEYEYFRLVCASIGVGDSRCLDRRKISQLIREMCWWKGPYTDMALTRNMLPHPLLQGSTFPVVYARIAAGGGKDVLCLHLALSELRILAETDGCTALTMTVALKIAASNPRWAKEHPIPQEEKDEMRWLQSLLCQVDAAAKSEDQNDVLITTQRHVLQNSQDFDVLARLELQMPQISQMPPIASDTEARKSLGVVSEMLIRSQEIFCNIFRAQATNVSALADRIEEVLNLVRGHAVAEWQGLFPSKVVKEQCEEFFKRTAGDCIDELVAGGKVLLERQKGAEIVKAHLNTPDARTKCIKANADAIKTFDRKALPHLRDMIVRLLNTCPEDGSVASLHGAGLLKTIGLEDVCRAHAIALGARLQSQTEDAARELALKFLRRYNPHISKDNFAVALDAAQLYIEMSNLRSQLQRINGRMVALEQAMQAKESIDVMDGLFAAIYDECTTLPIARANWPEIQDDAQRRPLFELMEFFAGNIRLKHIQIQATHHALQVFSAAPHSADAYGLLQLGMGFGKSDVLAPFWLYYITVMRGELAWYSVPASLLDATSANLTERLRPMGLSVVKIDPRTNPEILSSTGLMDIIRAIKENENLHDRVFLIADEAWRMLIYTLNRGLLGDHDVLFPLVHAIWSKASMHSTNLVDEVQDCCNPRITHTVQLTGQKQSLDSRISGIIQDAIARCVCDKTINEELGLSSNQQASRFNEEKWKTLVKQRLAHILFDTCVETFNCFLGIRTHANMKLQPSDRVNIRGKAMTIADIIDYIAGNDTSNSESVIDVFSKRSVDALNDDIRYLHFCRILLRVFLPNQFRHAYGVGYGPDASGLRCVPYVALRCPALGWYRNPIEECLAEACMFLQGPISQVQFDCAVANCLQFAYDEHLVGMTPIDETPTGRKFKELFDVELSKFIGISEDKQLPAGARETRETILQGLNGNNSQRVPRRMWLLKFMPKVEYASEFLETYSAELTTFTGRVLAMSGTPNFRQTLHPKFYEGGRAFLAQGSVGAVVLQQFLDLQSGAASVCIIDTADSQTAFRTFWRGLNSNISAKIVALMDMAAAFKMPAAQMADLVLRNIVGIGKLRGVLFHDVEHHRYAIATHDSAGSTKVIQLPALNVDAIEQAGFKPKDLFVLFDQSGCTGTNVPGLRANGHGMVTIEPNELLMNPLAQACMRMRAFGNGQHIDFLVSKSGLAAFGIDADQFLRASWQRQVFALLTMMCRNAAVQDMEVLPMGMEQQMIAEFRAFVYKIMSSRSLALKSFGMHTLDYFAGLGF
ncbi:MAG: hypothetical protein LBC42_03385, partial [Puniceicoccales bacterium]|nr:hypothetical protein [Puniceicoccales bacterium]